MTPELEQELHQLRQQLDEAVELRRAIIAAEVDGFVIGHGDSDRNVIMLGTYLPERQTSADEARDALRAIRRGEVDAFVIRDSSIATLDPVPESYRLLAERVRRHEAADARTRKFLGMLAHEFRNSLAAMELSTVSLKRQRLDDSGKKAAETLERRISSLIRLVDDLSAINPQE